MAISYRKSVKNRERGRWDAQPMSVLMVTRGILGFRESAELVKLADVSGCQISLTSGSKNGSTDSVLSLTSMGLAAGHSVVLSVEGRDKITALSGCAKILDGSAL